MIGRRLRERRQVRAARAAFGRLYGVPYEYELTEEERAGMRVLERRGRVEFDQGSLSGLDHWHRRVPRP